MRVRVRCAFSRCGESNTLPLTRSYARDFRAGLLVMADKNANDSLQSMLKPQLDEESDSLSTLSFSLALILQIASTSLYRLSSSTHIQLHPSIPPHVHAAASADNGLVAPAQMRDDIRELVDDLMDRCKWMKDEINALGVEETDEEHASALQQLDADLRKANEEYAEAVAESEALQKQVQDLLYRS
ncbi:unnamed protein product [Parajaminaea phylloscopi]